MLQDHVAQLPRQFSKDTDHLGMTYVGKVTLFFVIIYCMLCVLKITANYLRDTTCYVPVMLCSVLRVFIHILIYDPIHRMIYSTL